MSESIEVNVIAFPQVSYSHEITKHVPGGNRADGSRATWTLARRAKERERLSQSK